ncbi:hypothetical protein A3A71_00495 [Candidatus Berkelbacteria bacterium RIFCSPLOWO2_01_FULL_50_28]|uniref:Chromosomal replication initiator protein DnaA n=1 Tax=Candidatus Berkelbacteria bacterium RIFCSPLOWO2_01_FULL_50_28 TaxID=1797471 RepID=A0A1F5EBD4_9BACT|nr:MAG: hypothetical protein A2807_01245 [Candidatus Berkelbacteria bacterium RIFCSPHIGHO2_01_FULL_50_36]OGD62336.1 MAG: hypothetical protein A3F39_02655 [Candidatus Berkelbacteria bacterium RIFCSPHIGHO2_12_FULL_50_11]OGD64524.1 MAG: hypothetical protein A3A71_00495 [Candidatus Berkelbacteria bacterium RIFCSPLOWO2_01_FULL_50_28]
MSEAIWQDILQQLKSTVSRPNFDTWLKPVRFVERIDNTVTLAVPNLYTKSWVEANAAKSITKILSDHFGADTELRLVVSATKAVDVDELPLLQVVEDRDDKAKQPPREPPQFNQKYTFDTFVVGNNNRLAFAAAQAVAEKPGSAYNPLFIYGGVGLGKTHLMQAVANAIYHIHPKKKIIYTSCEAFTGEFINALQSKTINQFKNRYRTVDVFLVDDIQFLANKEGTQEEFFHTFNTLHQSNRQIILTADRLPKEMSNLEERLISRFGWGMIADIQSPNFETRSAILREKAEQMGVNIPDEVIDYVANQITNNVRELEGALTKLTARSQLEKIPLNLELARVTVKDLSRANKSNLTAKKVIRCVANHFEIEPSDILGKKRHQELVYPRQIVMYLLREVLDQSFPQIGDQLGGRDHTTIMHGSRKIEAQMKNDPDTENDVKIIINSLHD